MLREADGSLRYFTVREAARLQTFPDRYHLHGPWGEAMRQLGNAVPVMLAEMVAASVREHLALADVRAATAGSAIASGAPSASA
jgi:DNA (cytosine-5)-methyltransferase 1